MIKKMKKKEWKKSFDDDDQKKNEFIIYDEKWNRLKYSHTFSLLSRRRRPIMFTLSHKEYKLILQKVRPIYR